MKEAGNKIPSEEQLLTQEELCRIQNISRKDLEPSMSEASRRNIRDDETERLRGGEQQQKNIRGNTLN